MLATYGSIFYFLLWFGLSGLARISVASGESVNSVALLKKKKPKQKKLPKKKLKIKLKTF